MYIGNCRFVLNICQQEAQGPDLSPDQQRLSISTAKFQKVYWKAVQYYSIAVKILSLKKVPLKGMKIEIYTANHYYNVLFNNKVSWNRIHFARLTSFRVFKYDHDIFRVFRYDHDPILGYNDDSLIMLMQAKILYIQITYQYNIFQVSNTFSTNYYNNMYIKSIIS